MVLYYNNLIKKYKIVIILIFMIIIYILFFLRKREGYISQNIEEKFINIQKLINPNIIFDLNEIKKTANKDEFDYFIKNNIWPWSKETEILYINAINKNHYIRTYPLDELIRVKRIYNEKSILNILSWDNDNNNDKYINNLPSGFGDYPYNSGEIK